MSTDLPPDRIAFIGGGNMATAIVGGLQRQGLAGRIQVVEPLAEARHFRQGSKDQNDPVYAIRRGPLARPPLSDR